MVSNPGKAPGKYIVSEEHRFIYCVVPKVACSSVKAALAPLFGLNVEVNTSRGVRVRPHQAFNNSACQIRRGRLLRELREGRYGDYFIFGFVRNPFDRLVSCYFQKLLDVPEGFGRHEHIYPDMPFTEFVEAVAEIPDEAADPHLASQHVPLLAPDDKIMPSFVGRFEHLREDFAHVTKQVGAPELALPHYLRSSTRKGRLYHEFYDRYTRRLVEERYAKDLELFNYSFYSILHND